MKQISAFFIVLLLLQNTQTSTNKTIFSTSPMKIKMFRGLDESGLNHPIFIDLDSDGDYDFVLPAGDYPKYFQNDGDDSDPYFVEVDTMFLFLKPYLNPYQVWSYHVMHIIRFFDYDSDGDQDIGHIFVDWVKDTVHIFENIGSPQHPHWSNTPIIFDTDVTHVTDFRYIDLVNDSIPEIILAGHEHWDSIDYVLRLYEQVGDSLVEVPDYFQFSSPIPPYPYYKLLPLELFFYPPYLGAENYLLINFFINHFVIPGGMEWATIVFRNIGSSDQPLWEMVAESRDEYRLRLNPVSYPDPQLPLAAYWSFESFSLFYHEMIIDSGEIILQYPEYWLKGEVFHFPAISSFDWRKNGIQDIVLASTTQIWDQWGWGLYRPFYMCIPDFIADSNRTHYNFDPAFPLESEFMGLLFTAVSLDFADLDGDHDMDIVSGKEGSLSILWNTGNDSFPDWSTIQNLPMNIDLPRSISLNDVDNDGDVDLLVSESLFAGIPTIDWYENKGSHQLPDFSTTAMVLCSLRHDAVDLADMDLDGDLDVIANMYYDYNDYRMEYLRNDGAGTTWVLTKIDSVLPVGLPVGTPHLVDVENDGDADLFVLTNDGDLYFVENLTYTNIVSESPALSRNFHLHQNYPNPFNPSTTIEFDMPKTSEVTLKIFNILGEEVATLLSASLLSGSHSVEWDASSLASGVYLYRLKAEDYVETRKMILMR